MVTKVGRWRGNAEKRGFEVTDGKETGCRREHWERKWQISSFAKNRLAEKPSIDDLPVVGNCQKTFH